MGTDLATLLDEYDRALGYTDALWRDLTDDEVLWRPHAESSAIGWHLGHQATVAHFMIRNLTAAEPSPDADLEAIMDSATPQPQRGDLPTVARIASYRGTVADRVRYRIGQIADGEVGAPRQLSVVAVGVLTALVDHEYQHSRWIGEVRSRDLGHSLPTRPSSPRLRDVDGYLVVAAPGPEQSTGAVRSPRPGDPT